MRLREPQRRPIAHVHRVFVSGAAGFIGSHLVERLLAENYEVVGYDNFSFGQKRFLKKVWTHPNFTMVQGDLLDPDLMASAMSGCDLVFHLAGNTNTELDVRSPGLDLTQNTTGTLQLMQAMLAASVPRLFFVSTSDVYGRTLQEPVPETNTFPQVDTLYGTSKLAAEGIIRTYTNNFRLEATILRAGSVIGPRARRNPVADIYRALVIQPNEFQVPVPANQRLSFLHIHDLLEATFHVLTRQGHHQQHGLLEVYNVGSNEVSRFSDVIRLICRFQGLMPGIKLGREDTRSDYANKAILLDTTRLRQTGWVSRCAIQDGIKHTVEWLRSNHWALGEPYDQLEAPARQTPASTPLPDLPRPAPGKALERPKRSLIKALLPGG